MHEYDIIIVGAGIAGCAAAFNIKKEMPNKKILLLDKEEIGAHKGYGFRNTSEESIKEYSLSTIHEYRGIKGGAGDETLFKLDRKFFLFNYQDACKYLAQKAEIKFKKEVAIKVGKNTLLTDKAIYKFKYLIDCSGHNFFTKKQFNKPKPFRYWLGKTRELENVLPNQNYFYYQFSNTGHMDEVYPMKDRTLQGDWQYYKKIDFGQVKTPKQNILKTLIENPIIKSETRGIIPCTPALPLVRNNILLLGNSFGNSSTASAEGITPILKTSKILAKAIKKNNPKEYETEWKKENLNNYLKFLTIRLYGYSKTKRGKEFKGSPEIKLLCKKFSKYPEVFEKILLCDSNLSLPEEIKQIYPKRKSLFLAAYYTSFKLRLLENYL